MLLEQGHQSPDDHELARNAGRSVVLIRWRQRSQQNGGGGLKKQQSKLSGDIRRRKSSPHPRRISGPFPVEYHIHSRREEIRSQQRYGVCISEGIAAGLSKLAGITRV